VSRRLVVLPIALVIPLAAPAARGQKAEFAQTPPIDERARELKALGDRAMDSGRPADALAEIEKLERSAPPELEAKVPGLAKLLAELRQKVIVSVDGARAGVVPVELTLRAGSHRVELAHDGHGRAETSALIAAGARRTIDVQLDPEPPVTAKWWFSAGIGVVVAGGVASTAAALTEKSPSQGTIEPRVVSDGLATF
jgi:hypothetical protein